MSFWSWITGVDNDPEKDRAVDARLRELNRQKFESGQWSADDYAASELRFESYDYDYEGQIGAEFQQGVNEQADKLRSGADSFISGTLGTALRLVPVWVWLALAVFIAWKIGAFNRLLEKRRA